MLTLPRPARGFTLIELLIVVAIIAILAAIAVPNFLEAQTRAKISRVLAEFRTYNTALETYRLDYGKYPKSIGGAEEEELAPLTTPVAYLNALTRDVFKIGVRNPPAGGWGGFMYDYILCKWHPNLPRVPDMSGLKGGNSALFDCVPVDMPTEVFDASYGYFMFSIGPDRDEEYDYRGMKMGRSILRRSYDASNGTVSSGDIYGTNGMMY